MAEILITTPILLSMKIALNSATSVTNGCRIWRATGLALLLATVSVGCVTSAPLAPEPDVTLSKLTVEEARQAAPVAPQTVRWGGTIVGIVNTDDNKTQVEIVSRPLQRSGRPINNDRTDGRFIAEFNDFLDPEIYTTGRDLSVIGTVTDIVDGRIGETEYRFPLLLVTDHRYWKPVPPREYYHHPIHDHYRYDPFWRDRYRYGRGGSLHGRIILQP